MKTSYPRVALAAALSLTLGSAAVHAASFSYHGTLTDGGQSANGRYDLQIGLYGDEHGSAPLAPAITLFDVAVQDGSFSTDLDFGNAGQNGGWVGVSVRKAGSGGFVALDGRSAVEPAGACPASWLLDGNAGTTAGTNYLGTADAADLVLKAGGSAVANFNATGHAAILTPFSGASVPGIGSTSVSYSNGATGDYSFAGGFTGATVNTGSFVWGDHSSGTIADSAANQFIVKTAGGAFFNGNTTHFGSDDLVVYARSGGDADADITVVSRSNHWGRMYIGDSTGILQLSGENGVHINNPTAIDGALDAKSLAVEGTASKSTAGAWAANSDARIKQDIAPIDDALDTLAKLHPVTFRYTDAYRAGHAGVADQRYYNVIAQQFAEVFPDAVKGSGEYLEGAAKTPDNEILQVDTYPAQIVTIAAVQELAQKNAALQATVDRLIKRIAKLETTQGR